MPRAKAAKPSSNKISDTEFETLLSESIAEHRRYMDVFNKYYDKTLSAEQRLAAAIGRGHSHSVTTRRLTKIAMAYLAEGLINRILCRDIELAMHTHLRRNDNDKG